MVHLQQLEQTSGKMALLFSVDILQIVCKEISLKKHILSRNGHCHDIVYGKWTLRLSTDSQTLNTKFTACVEPSELDLVLPSALASQFSSSTNSSDLITTLTNGLSGIVPSSLITIRAASDENQSPILGAPFLSQVYLFIDYQEKTFSTGLANNGLKILPSYDTLQCIEHENSTGDLGWAVGSLSDLAVAASASKTTTASESKNTEKSCRETESWWMVDSGLSALVMSLSWL